jgi:protein-disulfide isomerase
MNAMPPLLPDDHSRGPSDAPLTIVQYGDYDCPHTRASAAVIRELHATLAVPIRFVFRHFPLRHLHANAQILSEIAEAATTLGHFWNVHDRLMAHRRGITERDVLDDLGASGIDVATLQGLLDTPPIRDRIGRDVTAGSRSGVHSTPTWYFNASVWDGHYDLVTLLDRARASLPPAR